MSKGAGVLSSGSRCSAHLILERLPVVRWSTRQDLYQALIRGRAVLTRRYAEAGVMEEAREAAGLSSYHFQRLFKALFEETPHSYRSRQRMQRAERLLRETSRPIRKVALECGYASAATFTRTVRREMGASPGEIRKIGQSQGR